MECQKCQKEIEETVFFPMRGAEDTLDTLCEECYVASVPTSRRVIPITKEIILHEKTIEFISGWLNGNGFVEASKAIDCEFEL